MSIRKASMFILGIALISSLATVSGHAQDCPKIFLFGGASTGVADPTGMQGNDVRGGFNVGSVGHSCTLANGRVGDEPDTFYFTPGASAVYAGLADTTGVPSAGTLKIDNATTVLHFVDNSLRGRYESQSIALPSGARRAVLTITYVPNGASAVTESLTYTAAA